MAIRHPVPRDGIRIMGRCPRVVEPLDVSGSILPAKGRRTHDDEVNSILATRAKKTPYVRAGILFLEDFFIQTYILHFRRISHDTERN